MSRPNSPTPIAQGPILQSLERETAALLDRIQAEFLEIDLQGQPVFDRLTGGHILTHLAREADRMADEILEATGNSVPPTDNDRQWEVERGGDRPGAVLIGDLVESSQRLTDAFIDVDWSSCGTALRELPGRRLVQIVIHHADLQRPWHSMPEKDAAIALAQLPHVMSAELVGIQLVARPGGKPIAHIASDNSTVVEGEPRALLAWATGRAMGTETFDLGLPELARRIWF